MSCQQTQFNARSSLPHLLVLGASITATALLALRLSGRGSSLPLVGKLSVKTSARIFAIAQIALIASFAIKIAQKRSSNESKPADSALPPPPSGADAPKAPKKTNLGFNNASKLEGVLEPISDAPTSAPPRHSVVTPAEQKEVMRAFFYLNASHMSLDPSQMASTGKRMRLHLLRMLERLSLRGEERKSVDRLIDHWKQSAQVEADPSLFFDRLTNEGEVALSCGWSAKPSGHATLLHLYYKEGKVRGRFYDRGAGAHHQCKTRVRGKRRVAGYLELGETSIGALQRSQLIPSLLELQTLTKSDSQFCDQDETEYCELDLYQAVLSLWPAAIYDGSGSPMHIPQRGPTCAVHSLLTQMEEILGKRCAARIRLLLELQSFQDYLWCVGQERQSRGRIVEAAEGLAASALKLSRRGWLDEEDAAEIVDLVRSVPALPPTAGAMVVEQLAEPLVSPLYKFQCPPIAHRQDSLASSSSAPAKSASAAQIASRLEHLANSGQSAEVKRYGIEQVEMLEPAGSPYWNSRSAEARHLLEITRQLDFAVSHRAGDLHYTPRLATALLKLNAIAVAAAEPWGLPPKLVRFYTRRALYLCRSVMGDRHRPNQAVTMQQYRESVLAIEAVATRLDVQDRPLRPPNCKGGSVLIRVEDVEFETVGESDPEIQWLVHLLRHLPPSSAAISYGEYSSSQGKDKTMGALYHLFAGRGGGEDLPSSYRLLRQSYWSTAGAALFLRSHDQKADSLRYRWTFYISSRAKIGKNVWINNCKERDKSAPLQRGYAWDSMGPSSGEFRTFVTDLFARSHPLHQNRQLHSQSAIGLEGGARPIGWREVQGLLSTMTSELLLIPQTVHYFNQNLDRFNDRRFCNLLEALLLTKRHESDHFLITYLSEHHPSICDQLWDFLSSSVARCEEVGWIEGALHLQWMQLEVAHILSEPPEMTETIARQIERFNESCHDPQRAEICHWIALLAARSSDKEICDLALEAYRQITIHGFSYSWEGRVQLEEAFFEAQVRLEQQLKESGQTKTQMLPVAITSHDAYLELYDRSFAATQDERGRWRFRDHRGVDTEITTSKSSLSIYQWRADAGGEQRRFLYDGEISIGGGALKDHPLGDGIIARGYTIWRGEEEALLLGRTTLQCDYRIRDGELYRWGREERPLHLANVYTEPVVRHLSKIAPSGELLAWSDDTGGVVEIELPLYDVSFYWVDGKGWSCTLAPGFWLDTDVTTGELYPLQHVLPLRREEERLFIIPDLDLKIGEPQLRVAVPQIESKEGSQLFVYRVAPSGEVEAPFEVDALLYLTYLHMARCDYPKARELLDQLEKEPREWNEPSKRIAAMIEGLSSDHHPRAAALRLKLRFLAEQFLHVKIESDEAFSDCEIYCNGGHHILSYELSDQQQVRVDEAAAQLALSGKRRKEPTISFGWIDRKLERAMLDSRERPAPPRLRTRPGSRLIENFLAYYKIARERRGSGLDDLLLLLRLSRFTTDERVQSLHQVLMCTALCGREELSHLPTAGQLEKAAGAGTLAQVMGSGGFRPVETPPEWTLQVEKGAQDSSAAAAPPLEPSKPIYEGRLEPSLLAMSVDYADLLAAEDLLVDDERAPTVIASEIEKIDSLLHHYQARRKEPEYIRREFSLSQDGLIAQKRELESKLRDGRSFRIIDPSKREAAEKLLTDRRNQLHERAEELKASIMATLRQFPLPSQVLELECNLLCSLTIDEAIALYGRGDLELLVRYNPTLSADQLEALHLEIGRYLLAATEVQHLDRSIGHGLERITARRCYSGESKAIPILAFEYFGKLRLRHNQRQALEMMTQMPMEDIEKEAGTGWGKSKVLFPLWAVLTSKEDHCTAIAVPAHLYDDTLKHLRKVVGRPFNLMICPLRFSRSKAESPHYLHQVLEKIDSSVSKRQVVLTDIRSLHGMSTLKLKECLAATKENFCPERAQLLLRIRIAIETKLVALFDESDLSFNLATRYDYAIGKRELVDREMVELVKELYHLLFVKERRVYEQWNFDFLSELSTPGNPAAALELYDKKLLPLLAEVVADNLQIPQEHRALIVADLQGNYSPACEPYYKTLSQRQLERYNCWRRQLTVHLKRTLPAIGNKRYALCSPDVSPLPKPCRDAKVLPDSEFVDEEDLLNFTMQIYLRGGIKQRDVEHFFDLVRATSIYVKGDLDALAQTALGQLYLRLARRASLPPLRSLGHLHKEHAACLAEVLAADRALLTDFIAEYFAIQSSSYQEKASSNPYTISSLPLRVQAASGTVTPEMMDPRFTTRRDVTATVRNQLALWEVPPERLMLLPLTEGSCEQRAEARLIAHLEMCRRDQGIIDCAGLYSDLSTGEFAHILFEQRPKTKGLCFYDSQDRLMVLERGHTRPIPRSSSTLTKFDLFFLYRPANTVGADVDVPDDLQAMVTLGRDGKKRRFWQAIGRLRKAREGQQLGIIVTAEDWKEIGEEKPLSREVINDYLHMREANAKAKLYMQKSPALLTSRLESRFWAFARRNVHDIESVWSSFQQWREVMIETTKREKLAGFRSTSGEQPAGDAMPLIVGGVAAKWRRFLAQNPAWKEWVDLDGEVKSALETVDYGALPSHLPIGLQGASCAIVEATHDAGAVDLVKSVVATRSSQSTGVAASAADRDQMRELDVIPKIHFKAANPLPWKVPTLTYARTLLGVVRVCLAPNSERVATRPDERLRKPAVQYLVRKDEKMWTYVPLDLIDAERALCSFGSSDAMNGFSLFSDRWLLATDGGPEKPPLPVQIVAKLYAGEERLSDKERAHLRRCSGAAWASEVGRLSHAWPHIKAIGVGQEVVASRSLGAACSSSQ